MKVIKSPNLIEKKRNFALLVLFVLSLTVKMVIFYCATDPIVFTKYPFFAEQLANGKDIGERILDLSPSYLYLTTLFYKVYGPDWEALALLQILLGSLNCVLVYFIGARTFGSVVGLLAAAMLMLYGNITLVELTLEPEAFVLLLNSLTILALLHAGDDKQFYRPWRWFLAGALIGLSAITKANGILIMPGALIWIWLSIKNRGNQCRAAAALLLGAFLLISPVTIRNYIAFHDFVLITADGGKVFFHGNGPRATGMARADVPDQGFIEEGQREPDYAHALFRITARAATKTPLKPSECADFWFSQTKKHIQGDPLAAAYLEWKKFCLFWNDYEVHDLDSTYKSYTIIQKWPFVTMGVIAALGILGMAFSLNRLRHVFLLYWMIFIYLCSVLIFFSASRYRLPAVPFLCIFASQFIMTVFFFMKEKEIKKTVICLALIPLLLAWTHLPFQQDIRQFDRWQQASRIHFSEGREMLFIQGRYQEAIQEFETVIVADPYFTPAYNLMGKSYAFLGQYDKADACFKKVIMLAPGIDEGHMNIGLLLELRGKPSEALPYFEKALQLNPQNKKAKAHMEKLKGSTSRRRS
jgi:tetratricopeptide (TPR) repeat protein